MPKNMNPGLYGRSLFVFVVQSLSLVQFFVTPWTVAHQTSLPIFLYPFAFSPARNESSCCSTSLSTYGVVSVPDFDHSGTCIVAFCGHFICISLMTYDVDHLPICSFPTCVSSLIRCLFRSFAHENNWIIYFLI